MINYVHTEGKSSFRHNTCGPAGSMVTSLTKVLAPHSVRNIKDTPSGGSSWALLCS